MKDRGKSVVEKQPICSNSNFFPEFNYSVPDLPCRKHHSSSTSVGICAQCLKDRLLKLVCSDCGEQRLSSCSCSSDLSSNRNSSCTVDVGSVGRISFLIENEKSDHNPDHHHHQNPHSKPKIEYKSEDNLGLNLPLKRSRSTCMEGKKGGFWRIGRFFGKKKEERRGFNGKGNNNDLWLFDKMRVSRSRSLCSFRGHGDEGASDFALSSAKISDFNGGTLSDFCEPIDHRKSGGGGARGSLDSANGADFKYYGTNIKASDVNAMDESGFIDLKLDLLADSRTEYSVPKLSEVLDSDFGSFRNGGNFVGINNNHNQIGDDDDHHFGSCRISINDRGMKKCSRGNKVWRWIFKHHQTPSKKDENNHILKL